MGSDLRERKKHLPKKAPLTEVELDIAGLLGQAGKVGRLMLMCSRKELSWAAYFTENGRLREQIEEFCKKYEIKRRTP